jgi:hypothetical protein
MATQKPNPGDRDGARQRSKREFSGGSEQGGGVVAPDDVYDATRPADTPLEAWPLEAYSEGLTPKVWRKTLAK